MSEENMTWHYGFVVDEENNGYAVAEIYSHGCVGTLNESDWWGMSREEIVGRLEMILTDLKREIG